MIDRRHFLAAASAAAVGAAAPAPAHAAAPTAITTQLQWIKDVQAAGWWLADANGYFRDTGIAATMLAGGPNLASIATVVAAGRADVGVDQLEKIVDANAQGEDFVIFGAVYQTSPAAFMSLPAHPLRTARDFLGKRIGLQQGAKLYMDAILKVNGLPPNYTEVVVGFDPEPLLQGACDAYLCFLTNQPVALAARHVPTVTTTFDQLGYVTYSECLFCTRAFLAANRPALVAYVRALQRGWAANARDPARAAHLAATVYGASLGLDEAGQLAIDRGQIPLMEGPLTRAHGRLWIDPARVAGPVYRTLRATGRTKLPPVERLVDTSIVRDAQRA